MDKVACRTPAAGRDGVTNIPAWKFDLIRDAILGILSEGPAPFSDLAVEVKARLSADDLSKLGSVGWHVTTVKLEMEMRGEIERVPGAGPQQIKRVE